MQKKAMKRKSQLFDNNDKTHKRSKPNNHRAKMGAKRKAENAGENPPPIKKYKFFTTKNVEQNIIKRNSELCDTNDKPNSHVEKNIASNISLHDHLASVVEKATMSNKQMWDSLRLTEIDGDSVDEEIQIVPTTSTNNNESLLNNEQDGDVVTDTLTSDSVPVNLETIAERQLADLTGGKERSKVKAIKKSSNVHHNMNDNIDYVPTLVTKMNENPREVLKVIAKMQNNRF